MTNPTIYSTAYGKPGDQVCIWNGTKIVRRSRNLRGLITHAGKAGVYEATVHRAGPHGEFGHVWIRYSDGSTCRTSFADFTVARDFLRARWRKWGLMAEVRNSDDYWSFIAWPWQRIA